jgi:hypothetical protein
VENSSQGHALGVDFSNREIHFRVVL